MKMLIGLNVHIESLFRSALSSYKIPLCLVGSSESVHFITFLFEVWVRMSEQDMYFNSSVILTCFDW